jgi:hypothetical protein
MTHLWHESQSPVTGEEYGDLLDTQPSHLTIKRERKLLTDRTEAYIAQFRHHR